MKMPRTPALLLTLLVAACGGPTSMVTPAPVEPAPALVEPTKPAARTLRYSVVTAGRVVGGGETTLEPDGLRRSRYSYNDRGRGPDLTTTLRLDAQGFPVEAHTSGVNYWKAPV